MILTGSRPWLLSLGLHGLVGALVLGLFLVPVPPVPPAMRMHLVAAGAGKSPPPRLASQAGGGPPARSTPTRAAEPALPSWRGTAPVLAPDPVVPAPVSLDELLGAAAPAEARTEAKPVGGWSMAGGEGYAPPPLPPPGLAPPQGARWTLILSIPGGGGFTTHFEGLDSGHPELDRWLETYLRTVSFPSSLDGQDYQLKWTLRLDTGRPR